MEYQAFIEQVVGRAQFQGPPAATRAIEATLHALAQPLSAHVVHEIARHLPVEMAAVMRSASGPGSTSARDLYARVSERTGLPLWQALEQAQIVCAVLAEQLDPDLVGRLSRALPDEIAALLSTAAEHAPLASPVHPVGHGQTLAEGKPGATHTLSEGMPGSRHPLSEGQPRAAHAHSLAKEDDPHEESKVSSARGLTQEREHETLAEGRSKRS